jgi:hypothetical protein
VSKEDVLALIELAQRYPAQKQALLEIAVELTGDQASVGGDAAASISPTPVVSFPLEVYHINRDGERATGKMFQDGRIQVNGSRAMLPSPAAGLITGNSVDGWTWWFYRDPRTGERRKIDYLRKQGLIRAA